MKRVNLFRSAIPIDRGIAEHIETGKSDTAMTQFSRATAKVDRVFTPDEPIKRVHELLHAQYTDIKESWPSVSDNTRTFIEDSRLHLNNWPWEGRIAPKIVLDSIKRVCTAELKVLLKELKINPKADESPLFRGARLGTIMRALSLPNGAEVIRAVKEHAKLLSRGESHCLGRILGDIKAGDWRNAAILFDALVNCPKPEGLADDNAESETQEEQHERDCGLGKESMIIIEMDRLFNTLPFPVCDTELGSSGRTLNWRELVRGKLRRSNRMFSREIEEDSKGGTILIDASGSMEIDSAQLASLCRSLPAATIAYYFGTNDFEGQLYVYARNGKRADTTPIYGQGNSIDGSALAWLLKESGPRYFVTDVGFCDAGDLSALAIAHFEQCVRNGSIEHIGSIGEALPYFERLSRVAA